MFDVQTERVAMKWAYIIVQVDFNLFEMCSNSAKGEVYNIMG